MLPEVPKETGMAWGLENRFLELLVLETFSDFFASLIFLGCDFFKKILTY